MNKDNNLNDSYIDEIKDINVEDENFSKETEKEEEPFSWKQEILSWVKIFIIALLIAAVLDNFIIINANVPSGSMEKTIMTGDRMIGSRLAYIKNSPKRGDVIIFKFPDDEKQNFVKRVIGLPGEKVVVKEAKIYINDSDIPLEEDYLPEEWYTMNDGLEYQVPEDSYLVFGDNRNISSDARYWTNKFVKKEAIIAKAVIVYWPLSDAGIIKSAEYSIDE